MGGGEVAPISERRDPVNRTPSSVVLHRDDRYSSVTIVSRLRGTQAQSRGLGPVDSRHFPLLYCVKVVCVFHEVFCPATT